LPTVVTTHEDITRLLQSMGFDQVFNIVNSPMPCPECLDDLPSQDQSEEVVRVKVLEAHKILMGLNDSNREAFHDLVNARAPLIHASAQKGAVLNRNGPFAARF
jgi:hypothetical protein